MGKLHCKVQNQLDPALLRDMLLREYSDIFDGQVKVMPGERFHIHLNQDAKPFCVRTPNQPGGLVCPKGIIEVCGRETRKVPTSVT